MNKINPIYILGFFLLVLFVMIVQNISMQQKIIETAQQVSVIKQTGQEISSLKKHWKNPEEAKKIVDQILKHRDFKAKIVKQEKKATTYKIALQELDAAELDRFTSKILNEYITLKKMTVNRVSDNNISVNLEIEL